MIRPGDTRKSVTPPEELAGNGSPIVEEEKTIEGQNAEVAAVTEAGEGYDLMIVAVGAHWGLDLRRCPVSALVVRAGDTLAAARTEDTKLEDAKRFVSSPPPPIGAAGTGAENAP